jgi:hypothetical protein
MPRYVHAGSEMAGADKRYPREVKVNPTELQQSIVELVDFAPTPESEWVAKVDAAAVQVIAGAILHWRGGGGVTNVPDPLASRREAAQAILQARLSNQVTDAASKLHVTINSYQEKSSRQTAWVLLLTGAIVALTLMTLVGLIVQIKMAASSITIPTSQQSRPATAPAEPSKSSDSVSGVRP